MPNGFIVTDAADLQAAIDAIDGGGMSSVADTIFLAQEHQA